jgi:hypothetical protein
MNLLERLLLWEMKLREGRWKLEIGLLGCSTGKSAVRIPVEALWWLSWWQTNVLTVLSFHPSKSKHFKVELRLGW